MNQRIELDITNLMKFIDDTEIKNNSEKVLHCHQMLHEKKGAGAEFTGWLHLPSQTTNEFLDEINSLAKQIQANAEILLCIGIGGSYLGAKAIISALSDPFEDNKTKVIFLGQNLSADYTNSLLKFIKNKEIYVNVISKSGTTTEPAIAFRIIKQFMEKKYKKDAAKRIIATTDKEKGALKKLANSEGYKCYVIPDDVGGRFSVLTPVGLLPIAVSGFSIHQLIDGAKSFETLTTNPNIFENPSYMYALCRYLLYNKGYFIELLSNFEPSLHYFSEWWKQLYGESEGKNHKGIFPASTDFTTDLHSMGQYIQDGERKLFETFLIINQTSKFVIPHDNENLDGLNFLSNVDLAYVNHMAYEGTRLAHYEGKVPNMTIYIPKLNEYYLGQLIYFFEKAVAISGYLINVNPFDQPGVENYKKNMFILMKKPGFENEYEKLINTLSSTKKIKI